MWPQFLFGFMIMYDDYFPSDNLIGNDMFYFNLEIKYNKSY